jgi:hypothetical protein
VLIVAEAPRPVTLEVEGPEADRSNLEGEAKDGPHARLDSRRTESQPPGRVGMGQIRFEHGPVLAVSIHAGPLAERVLQSLDERAHLVGGVVAVGLGMCSLGDRQATTDIGAVSYVVRMPHDLILRGHRVSLSRSVAAAVGSRRS